METIGHEKVYVDGNYIREYLSVSRTKAYEIICEIAESSHEPDAVIKFGRCIRVRKDLLFRWAFEHGVGGGSA